MFNFAFDGKDYVVNTWSGKLHPNSTSQTPTNKH